MGLLKIIKKIKQKEKEIRLLLLGLDGAGKTTTVKKICGEDISDISPTYGFDIKTIEYKGFSLNVWDIGGQKSIRSYWRNYFEQTEGIIWVIDSQDYVRLEDCANELHSVLKQEKLAGASLLLYINKQDLAGALKPDEIAKRLGLYGEEFENRHWYVCPSSAVTGQGLYEGLGWLVDDINSRILLIE